VVIVTGGGHGIGRAYCLGIAREGGTAVVADIDEKAADGVAKAIKDSGGKSLATKVDVANFSSCKEMAQKTLDAHGKIDGLVNNAAIFLSVSAARRQLAESPKRLGTGSWRSTSGPVAEQPRGGAAMQQRKQGSVVAIFPRTWRLMAV
jgi:NAD(P)-dependent dehydrogenase (short-subunit alcohol dehydrogenase family)